MKIHKKMTIKQCEKLSYAGYLPRALCQSSKILGRWYEWKNSGWAKVNCKSCIKKGK